jgi:thiosulfate/3-mercaptopyruvate sulfurtransferase
MWIRKGMIPAVVAMGLQVAACGGEERPAGGAVSTEVRDEPAVRSDLLVTGEWLQENVGSPEIVLIHVGADEGEFRTSALPGARFVPISALNREREGIPNMLPDREELARTFADAGISSGSHVVVYGSPLAAARAFVALEHLGHTRVSLLDGGAGAWTGARGAAAGGPAPAAGEELRAAAGDGPIVDAAWVADRLGDAGVALLDARPAPQYTGEEAGDRVPRPGHIPGAHNLFWEELLVSTSDPRLRDEAELRALFRERGASPDRTVVTYCRTGMQASFAYFVARYLGYDARMYDGSFVDWSPRTELPVVTGSQPGA